jgi:8-oxo-dGTP pyrophosphatase MutT (NUDIX family)
VRTQEVIIVVRRGEEYLVVHRSPENDAYWHLIAGGVEDGESFADAAVRELQEETGLTAAVEALDASFAYESVHVECFVVEAPAAWEPALDWEHDGYRWLPREEAADLLHWPEPADLLRSLS